MLQSIRSEKTTLYKHVYTCMYNVRDHLKTAMAPACFKAVWTVLKLSGPFQSCPDGFEAVGAKICGFNAVSPAGFATGHAQYTRVYVRIVAPSAV